MKGNPYKMGKMATKSTMKMAKEAMKMKKESMAKLKEESAMKLKTSYKMKEAMAKMKEASAMKQAKPDYPDIDGDGNTTESMKKAAADKKTAMKQRAPKDKDQKKIQDKIDLEVRTKQLGGSKNLKRPSKKTAMKQRVPSDKDQKKIKDKIDKEILKKQLRLDEAKRPNKKSAAKMKPGKPRSKADKKQFTDVGPRKAGMSEAMAAGATVAAASKKAKSPNKLMGRVKKKVNKELETPAGQAMMKAASGGMMMKDNKKKRKETVVHKDDKGNVTSKQTTTYRKDGTRKKSKTVHAPASGKLKKAQGKPGEMKMKRTNSVIVKNKYDKEGNVKWNKSTERYRKSRKKDLEG